MMVQKLRQLADNTVLCYIIVFLAAAVLYSVTCAPGVLWQDSGLFQYRILHDDLVGNLGLALSHPLYIMIGILVKSIAIGDLAWRVNMISAICGGFAVANVFLLVKLWFGRMVPAIISAISLAVSWTFWQHAVMAEVYTLYAAQMLAELIVLLMYLRSRKVGYLYTLGLLNGLSIANHMMAVFGIACYFVLVVYLLYKKQVTIKNILIVIGLWVLGALPYEYLIVRSLIETGDIPGTIASALFGAGWQGGVTNASITLKIIAENIIFILLNFPTPNVLLLFVGIWAFTRKMQDRIFANVFAGLAILYFVFAFRYTVPDRYAFFLPFYCFASVFIGAGAGAVLQKPKSKRLIYQLFIFALLPVVVYFFTPEIGKKYYKSLGQRRQRPYRDEYVYFLQPWKCGYDGAVRFGREALEVAEEGSIIYSDTTSVHAILYAQQYEGLGEGIKIISGYDSSVGAPELNENTVEKYMNEAAVYVVSPIEGYCPKFMLENYGFEEVWPIYKVMPKQTDNLSLKVTNE